MNTVDNDSHEVMQLKGNSANSISKSDIGDTFHLSGDFLEEEMLIFSGYLGK